jgi:biuret amidohydrolase
MDREEKRRERLRVLIDPATTSVVTMEMQRGIIGAAAMLPALADRVAEAGTIDNAARVCTAARRAGAHVVHATAEHRPDGAGETTNCKLFAMGAKLRAEGKVPTEIGSEGAKLVAELGPEPDDIVVPRLHGMTPFMSTSLDQVLRNLDTRTIVATGVSVNLGMFGLCLNAVDLGYQVVLVRDAVAGVPADYADTVIDNSLSLITTITDSDELCALWDQTARN